MFINVSEDSPLIINFNEVTSISQQGDDVRIEMSGFAEHKFVANITVGDFISSLPEAVAREFRKISESDSGLHVRLSAISSISKQDYIADDTNTKLTLSGKHHHIIYGIDACSFHEKYIPPQHR